LKERYKLKSYRTLAEQRRAWCQERGGNDHCARTYIHYDIVDMRRRPEKDCATNRSINNPNDISSFAETTMILPFQQHKRQRQGSRVSCSSLSSSPSSFGKNSKKTRFNFLMNKVCVLPIIVVLLLLSMATTTSGVSATNNLDFLEVEYNGDITNTTSTAERSITLLATNISGGGTNNETVSSMMGVIAAQNKTTPNKNSNEKKHNIDFLSLEYSNGEVITTRTRTKESKEEEEEDDDEATAPASQGGNR
jgi:hypothetical protein